MTPAVTVLLAVHNGGAHLQEAVHSVLAQTFTDFELLLIDDASDDGALDRLPADPRIRIVRNDDNLGQIRSLNRGLHESRGALVARLDHDDLCLPRRLERQVELHRRLPEVALSATWIDIVDEEHGLWAQPRPRVDSFADFAADTITRRLRLAHPSLMFRRDVVLEVGGFDETLGAAEDQELYRRLVLARREARVVPEALVIYRRHDEQMTVAKAALVEESDRRSHEALLERLAPGAPAAALNRLFLADPGFWEATPLVPGTLDAFVATTAALLQLDASERRRLVTAIADCTFEALTAGWATGALADRERAAGPLAFLRANGSRSQRAFASLAPALRASAPVGRGVATTRGGIRRALHAPALGAVRRRARRVRALRSAYRRIATPPLDLPDE